MKIIYSVFVISSLVILSGCGLSDNDYKSLKNSENINVITIKGKSTLSNAHVCIDENLDSQCNENEAQSVSDKVGKYSINFRGSVDKNTLIVSQGGYNLLLLEENSINITLKKNYNSAVALQNINTISTLISNIVDNDTDYSEAKTYIATKYKIEMSALELDPVEALENNNSKVLFLTARAIEEYQVNKKAKLRAVESNVITEEVADAALANTDIFEFNITTYIKNFYNFSFNIFNYLQCTLMGNCVTSKLYTKPKADIDDSLLTKKVSKEELYGFWLMQNNSKAEYCLQFDTNGTYIEHKLYGSKFIYQYEYREEYRSIDLFHYPYAMSVLDYQIYRSANDKNKLYVTNSKDDNISFYYHENYDGCMQHLATEIDNQKGKFSHINARKDMSKMIVYKASLNGIWIKIGTPRVSKYIAKECVEIKDTNTYKVVTESRVNADYRFEYSDSNRSFQAFDKTGNNLRIDTLVYASKTEKDMFYFEHGDSGYDRFTRASSLQECWQTKIE